MTAMEKSFLGGFVLLSLLSIGCRQGAWRRVLFGPDLRGRVTDKQGKPVPKAFILVSAVHGDRLAAVSSGIGTFTDASGEYSFNPGHNDTYLYRINVDAEDFEPASRVVDPSTSPTIDFALQPAVVRHVTYKVGDEVEVRGLEWCPAHITGVRPDGKYEIEYDEAPTEREVRPPGKIRPWSDDSPESEFPCPFIIKRPKVH